MKKIFIIITMLLSIYLSACFKSDNDDTPQVVADSNAINPQQEQEIRLPEGFTEEKIEDALLEYINSRLWLYPAEIMDGITDKDFDNYIGKSIDVEIRVYQYNSENTVYAHTNIGEWLAIFRIENELVYCDGLVSESESYSYVDDIWPEQIDNYIIVKNYSTVIPEPHKPNYGTSERKDRMIEAFEAKIKTSLEDYYSGEGGDKWINVDVYIADFYEWEDGAHAWFIRQEGNITNYPVGIEEVEGEMKVQLAMIYGMDSINDFNKFGRFQFDRDISDAISHFQWMPE